MRGLEPLALCLHPGGRSQRHLIRGDIWSAGTGCHPFRRAPRLIRKSPWRRTCRYRRDASSERGVEEPVSPSLTSPGHGRASRVVAPCEVAPSLIVVVGPDVIELAQALHRLRPWRGQFAPSLTCRSGRQGRPRAGVPREPPTTTPRSRPTVTPRSWPETVTGGRSASRRRHRAESTGPHGLPRSAGSTPTDARSRAASPVVPQTVQVPATTPGPPRRATTPPAVAAIAEESRPGTALSASPAQPSNRSEPRCL